MKTFDDIEKESEVDGLARTARVAGLGGTSKLAKESSIKAKLAHQGRYYIRSDVTLPKLKFLEGKD
jgi:hypothetical protein